MIKLTPYHGTFYNEWKIDPQRGDYNIVFDQEIIGEMDCDRLDGAIKRFAKDYFLLHSVIEEIDGEYYWSELSNSNIKLDYFNNTLREAQLLQYVRKPFDLEKGPFFRCALLKIAEDHFRIILVIHHIVMDGVKAISFADTISAYYNDKNFSADLSLAEQRQKISELSASLEAQIAANKSKQQKFWKKTLQETDGITLDFLKPGSSIFFSDTESKNIIGEHRFVFDRELLKKIQKIKTKYGITPYLFGQMIFAILIYRYTAQSKFALSYPMAIPEGADFVYGAHINTNIICYEFRQDTELQEVLNYTKSYFKETKKNKNHLYPIQDIMSGVTNKNILDVGFIQTTLKDKKFSFANTTKTKINEELNIDLAAKLLFEQEVREDVIHCRVRFYKKYIDYELLINFLDAYKRLFIEILEDLLVGRINNKIVNYSVISEDQYSLMVDKWNATEKKYPLDKTIHQLFEEQVKRTPNNIALICEGVTLTYAELNKQANQLAHYLIKTYSIKPDDLVVVCLDRGQYMLPSILAILKSGAAYVPLDTKYPIDGIAYLLNDIKPKAILVNQCYEKKFTSFSKKAKCTYPVTAVDSKALQETLSRGKKTNPEIPMSSSQLAYVLYTSGTTGKPKGVMLEHRGIINRIMWMNDTYPLVEQDRILQKTPYTFDVSVWELFWANWYGACVVFSKPEGHKAPDYLISLINTYRISVLHFVPSMFSAFLQSMALMKTAPNSVNLPSLRYLFCSGEALALNDVRMCRRLAPHIQVHNLYGPTEASIDVLSYDCTAQHIDTIFIGRPIANTRVYILDSALKPVPMGVIGELYIGGVGLARGYLNRPELTAEKFIQNDTIWHQKLYKTGDLARWLPDGNIEYIGRNDLQVKIKGYRIELSEIEAALNSYPGITQSTVIVFESAQYNDQDRSKKYLVGYYVAKRKLDAAKILSFLSKQLLDYMLPATLVHLKKFPLTTSGKLDRKMLPAPIFTYQDTHISPVSKLEIEICKIYAEVLGLPPNKIGTSDNFFRLGGDSILAIRLVSKLNNAFNAQLKVKDIFESKTVSALVSLLTAADCDPQNTHFSLTYQPFSLVDVQEYKKSFDLDAIEDIYPASYLQVGMLFEANLANDGTYHDVFFYEIQRAFNKKNFLAIWDQLIAKHSLLRAKFLLDERNSWNVFIVKEKKADCRVYINQDLEQLINEERIKKFSYDVPGLFRLIINDHGDNFDFIFSFHHAITDGWSIASLVNEFVEAYAYDKPITIDRAENLTYGEFIKQERLLLEHDESIIFWQHYLAGIEFSPVKWKWDQERSANGLYISFCNLSHAESKLISTMAYTNAMGVDNVFLYAYIKTLSFFLNSQDVTVGLVVNNRLEKANSDALFGLFLNVIPCRVNLLLDCETVQESLKGIFKLKSELMVHKGGPYSHIRSLLNQDLYEFAFNFVHFHNLKASEKIIKQWGGFERTSVPFMLNVLQHPDGSFSLQLKAHDDRVSQDYLNYFATYLKNVLINVAHGQQKVFLTPVDYRKLIYDWNATEKNYPRDKTIHKLFEEQVSKTPNNVALVYEGIALTYMELNKKANQLAHYLFTHHHVTADSLVVLCLKRNQYTLIAILAVLKAGGGYVPLDPSYPDERIAYILKDIEPKAIITNEEYASKLKRHVSTGQVVTIELKETQNVLAQQIEQDSPVARVEPQNLAYVIYTSGTTGDSKGVMIEHRNLVSLLVNFTEYPLSKNGHLNILSTTNYVFDIFGLEYLLPLLNGYQMTLVNLANLTKKINLYEFDVIQITPSKLELLIEQLDYMPGNNRAHKVTILIGGEALNFAILDKIHKIEKHFHMNRCQISFDVINVYGPTETTIWSTATHLNYRDANASSVITIGKPLHNESVYVLDNQKNPLPIGAIGELYIGGEGVARGYFNKIELTDKYFIPNPFQTEKERIENKNSTLYKTRDLVQRLATGEIVYIGRNDFQEKIRGYRVELGEIENKLLGYPGIKQVVVLVQERKEGLTNKHLIAYYTASRKLDELKLQAYLVKRLPEYMLPGRFVFLSEFPLTMNGKLDKKALPDPTEKNQRYLAPRNEKEQFVCAEFAKVLGVKKIGIHDDFFECGGDSIKTITLVARLQSNFKVNVADIFKCRTPKKIAAKIVFEKNNLRQQLEKIKLALQYHREKYIVPQWQEDKLKRYLRSIDHLPKNYHKKPIQNVFLTGATGYLGSNLLDQLLRTTDYNIYLLVRADSEEHAFQRVNHKFQFYFEKNLIEFYGTRLFIFAADLEKNNFNLSDKDYNFLCAQVDSIIHSAALTKHYGDYDKFYSTNVQVTIDLLKLSKLTKLKDFHYISTTSVLYNDIYAGGSEKNSLFTEDDIQDHYNENIWPNIYIKTKADAEKEVLKYREEGVNANVYRVGNLAFIAKNYRVQENIEDNAFFNRLKCLFALQATVEELRLEEISFVDLTAQAIVNLFDKRELSNGTYHVFNPYLCNIADFFAQQLDFSVKVMPIAAFVDMLIDYLNKPMYHKLVERFLLHQGWLEEHPFLVPIPIAQKRTEVILNQLGFVWPFITPEMFNGFINKNFPKLVNKL